MNFLKAIEGLDGENLSSGILGYLLTKDESIRKVVLTELLGAFPDGVHELGTRCVCSTESGTRDTEGAPGRLDILVETDTVVIGIENKFLAAFSLKQPGKYIPEVRKRAKELSEKYKRDIKALLVVLVPESRKSIVEITIQDPNYVDQSDRDLVSIVTWQTLLSKMVRVESKDPIAKFLVEHLSYFVFESTASIEWLTHEYSALKERRSSSNANLQRTFVYQFRQFFENSDAGSISSRPGSRADWYIGYSILDRQCDNGRLLGWFGFYSTRAIDELRDEPERSELVLMTNFEVDLGPDFRRLTGKIKWSDNFSCFWIVQFKENWTDDSGWNERLKPFHAEIERQIARQGS